MFSQWRHTIETLAHSPKSSQDAAAEGSSLDATLRQSLASSSQLADSAITNLRKSLVLQRPGSPSPKSPPNDAPGARPRSTLEDRLRAKFAIGEASTGTSPNPSTRSTPSSTPTPATDHPLSPSSSGSITADSTAERSRSPTSIPLPASPTLAPFIQSPQPISAIVSQQLVSDPDRAIDPDIGETSVNETESAPAKDDVEPPSSVTTEDIAGVNSVGDPSVSEDTPKNVQEQDTQLDAEAMSATEVEEKPTDIFSPDAEKESPPTVSLEPVSTDASLSEVIDTLPPPEQETNPLREDPPPEKADEPPAIALPDVTTEVPREVEKDGSTSKQDGLDIESLRQRLRLVEQRFADVSTSFKRLQAEKAAADRVLQELTPLQTIQEADSLKDFLQNINLKSEMAQDEIKRLNGKLTRQEERIEELRDTHRLESKSQSEQIHRLQAQVDEAEALLKATQNSAATLQTESRKREGEISRLQGELDKMMLSVKDEEEKRVKAINLLKTVRQKLIKTEKERDETSKEAQMLRAKDKEEREKEKAERQKLQSEIEKANLDRETTIQGLRTQFEKETTALKNQQEKELAALRGQFELEIATAKSIHSREIEVRDSRVSELESSVQALTREKADLFDQLQMRQAELESSQSHLESLQSQYVEAQYQLREVTDQIGLLNEELAESRRDQTIKPHDHNSPTEEVTRLLSAAEAKYETRIADLRRQLAAVESERDEGEAEFSKKLAEKVKEIEQLKDAVSTSARDQQEEKSIVTSLQDEIASLKEEVQACHQVIEELRVEAGKITQVETAAQTQITEANARITALQQQLEEHKAREAQARAHNKTLREELRKVQSSAALLERQRNPGLGYWAAKSDGAESRSPTSSVSDLVKDSPRPASPTTSLSDEEVNFEYLRNVILQFLEHQEMRPHLVRILSTILHFTPQETRRLVAKV